MRRQQGREESRTRGGGVAPSPTPLRSPAPTTNEWACIGDPTSRVSSPTTPPSLSPPDQLRRLCDREIPHGRDDDDGGVRTVRPFSCRLESPLLCRVVHRALSSTGSCRSTPSTFHWLDLSPEFLVTHASLRRSPGVRQRAPEVAGAAPRPRRSCTKNDGERFGEDVLRSNVRPED